MLKYHILYATEYFVQVRLLSDHMTKSRIETAPDMWDIQWNTVLI